MSEAKPDCKELGLLVPVVDRLRCEGKSDCVRVCPHHVFEVRVLDEAERAALPFFPRLKSRFHGFRQAFAVRADECHACGECVTACPEDAIKLVRPSQPPAASGA
jgi:NAD-dependent dihydropyrimidine dehydrogenase PreA subunit